MAKAPRMKAGAEGATALATIHNNVAALQKKGGEALVVAKDKTVKVAGATKNKAVEIASDRRVQVTAASAAGGGAAVGAGGALSGLVAGGAIGAAVGIIPALFTFGLSIPVGAMLGGGTGLCVGTLVGGTTGVVGGGAIGYGAHEKRTEIHNGATGFAAYVR